MGTACGYSVAFFALAGISRIANYRSEECNRGGGTRRIGGNCTRSRKGWACGANRRESRTRGRRLLRLLHLHRAVVLPVATAANWPLYLGISQHQWHRHGKAEEDQQQECGSSPHAAHATRSRNRMQDPCASQEEGSLILDDVILLHWFRPQALCLLDPLVFRKEHEIRHFAMESDITFAGSPSEYKQNVRSGEQRATRCELRECPIVVNLLVSGGQL